jgi:hypothetical protein
MQQNLECRRSYWLYISEVKSSARGLPSSYLVLCATAPDRRNVGELPTAHYPSWSQLAKKLADCGIQGPELESAKADVDTEGMCTLASVMLSEEQVKSLGFV